MSVKSLAKGFTEVKEVSLAFKTYTMSVPASTGYQKDTVAHNLGRIPFIDFMLSNDGGATFIPPYWLPTPNVLNDFAQGNISAGADANNVYFIFQSTSLPIAFTVTIRYKLYVMETR